VKNWCLGLEDEVKEKVKHTFLKLLILVQNSQSQEVLEHASWIFILLASERDVELRCWWWHRVDRYLFISCLIKKKNALKALCYIFGHFKYLAE